MIAGFPNLGPQSFSLASPIDHTYNCVAWALERDQVHWWEPGGAPYFWPIASAPASVSVQAYISAFRTLGYRPCRSRAPLKGWEKIAIYTAADASFLHVAAQLTGGIWTSKLGQGPDITHHRLESLEGGLYGTVTHIMRRPDPTSRGIGRVIAAIRGLFQR